MSPPSSPRPRIALVVSATQTASAFLVPHVRRLLDSFDVDVLGNFSGPVPGLDPRATQVSIPVHREVSPLADLRAWRILRREIRARDYSVVLSVTPKAGLLAMTASRSARTPVRIHWFTGQVWATRTGLPRTLLKSADRAIARAATLLLVDSPSQRDFLVSEGVVTRGDSVVLGDGSICGVDTTRFAPSPARRDLIRKQLGVGAESQVLVFVGRITRDKGVLDLADAFAGLDRTDVYLVLVGPDENDLIPEVLVRAGQHSNHVLYVDATPRPEDYLATADIFCMPSYREGFGLSVVEASACGLPSVASDIYGLSDAVEDDITGVLVPAADVTAWTAALQDLLADPRRRAEMGLAGRRRVERDFSQDRLTGALLELLRAETTRRRTIHS